MTGTTISRLEGREELPGGRKAGPVRRNAYLLTVLYELDPAELDLTDDDGPGELAIARLRKELSATLDTAPVTIGYPAASGEPGSTPLVAAGHTRRPGTPDTAPVISFVTGVSCAA